MLNPKDSSALFRRLQVAAWTLPAITLATTYLAICSYADSLWPWQVIVHESGARSLIASVLYYEHAARELPLDLVLGIAVGASVSFVLPGLQTPVPLIQSRRKRSLLITLITLITAIIVTKTYLGGGLEAVASNLFQLHTRPGEPLSWGGHWRYHLLSRLSLMLLSLGFAGLLLLFEKGKGWAGSSRAIACFRFSLGLFTLLSVIFVPDLDPLIDTVFLGHQAREVFTHLLVTVPLSWAACLHLANHDRTIRRGTAAISGWPAWAGLIGSALILYLFAAAVILNSASQGQTDNFVLLVFPHFFEHSFSYVLVPLVAGLTFQTAIGSSTLSGNRNLTHELGAPSIKS